MADPWVPKFPPFFWKIVRKFDAERFLLSVNVSTITAILNGPKPSYLIFSKLEPVLTSDLSIALEIFSFGIFADLADWIADLNREFISGFLSPNFAATVISLDNFEKILDLCLSAFPFLCFIPAQCECPAINFYEFVKTPP